MLLLLLHYGDVDVVANSHIIIINGGANEVQIHKTRQNGILMNIGWLMDSDWRLISKLHWFWIHCQAGQPLREWSTEVHVIDGAANKKRNALTGRQPSSLQSGQSFLARLHLPPETLTQHWPILVATWEELWLLLHIGHAVLVVCDKATNLKLKFLGEFKMQTSFSN